VRSVPQKRLEEANETLAAQPVRTPNPCVVNHCSAASIEARCRKLVLVRPNRWLASVWLSVRELPRVIFGLEPEQRALAIRRAAFSVMTSPSFPGINKPVDLSSETCSNWQQPHLSKTHRHSPPAIEGPDASRDKVLDFEGAVVAGEQVRHALARAIIAVPTSASEFPATGEANSLPHRLNRSGLEGSLLRWGSFEALSLHPSLQLRTPE